MSNNDLSTKKVTGQIHEMFAKPEESIVPEMVDNTQELDMGRAEFQTLTNRLEYFNGQGVEFGLDENGQVKFTYILDGAMPRGLKITVEQFKAKTLWMAVLASILEEAEKNLSTKH